MYMYYTSYRLISTETVYMVYELSWVGYTCSIKWQCSDAMRHPAYSVTLICIIFLWLSVLLIYSSVNTKSSVVLHCTCNTSNWDWCSIWGYKSSFKHVKYSEICLERPLPWKTTCLEGPHIHGSRSHISMQLNLSPKTTCLERPYFYVRWGGLSRQVPLYL